MLEVIGGLGLPEPVRRYPLRLPGGRRVVFDFARPERPAAVEVDGRIWYATPAARRRDAERHQAVRVLGWTVERVTWPDLEERPGVVAGRLACLGFGRQAA